MISFLSNRYWMYIGDICSLYRLFFQLAVDITWFGGTYFKRNIDTYSWGRWVDFRTQVGLYFLLCLSKSSFFFFVNLRKTPLEKLTEERLQWYNWKSNWNGFERRKKSCNVWILYDISRRSLKSYMTERINKFIQLWEQMCSKSVCKLKCGCSMLWNAVFRITNWAYKYKHFLVKVFIDAI
jgi:hypothetical protein